MRERFVLERTVTTENGRTVLQERKYGGVLDADGTFRLRACCGKCLVVRQKTDEGAKKTFLNLGKVFLRALSKDLGLRDAKVTSNPGGIAVSGEATLIGMWENNGIDICLGQLLSDKRTVLMYRTVRHTRDYTGGHNNFLTLDDLRRLSYSELLEKLGALRKEGSSYERRDRAA